jgi:hypothetical protein
MANRLIRFIFFGNYFLGLLVVALSLETALQLQLPFNSPFYYAFMFIVVVLYYTYAYSGKVKPHSAMNARTKWYHKNYRLVRVSQLLLLVSGTGLAIALVLRNIDGIMQLPVYYWLILAIILVLGLLYYGLVPGLWFRLNLRNTGLFKAFVIGFLWACCVSLLPIVALRVEKHVTVIDAKLVVWSFVKNLMFCTVNAIMFDIKDYADDSNRQLKTFVVRFGLRRTIFYVLFPLLIVGIMWGIVFTSYYRFKVPTILLNMVPFVSLLFVAYSLQRRKSILYYLVVIDGLLLLKACCGIAGSFFAR